MAPSNSDPLYNIVNPQLVDVFRLGKELMNRSRNPLGSMHKGGTEDRRFREFYGVSAGTALDTWNRLSEQDLTPAGGKFIHLLWTLMFFKLYGIETDLCAHAGGIYGAIDKKTFRKWTWPMAEALAELEYSVVSACNSSICYYAFVATKLTLAIFTHFTRFVSIIAMSEIKVMIVYFPSMALILGFPLSITT
jgi:hypothetical protein